MIERANIVEDSIQEAGQSYFLSVLADMDDEAGTIEVEIRLIGAS